MEKSRRVERASPTLAVLSGLVALLGVACGASGQADDRERSPRPSVTVTTEGPYDATFSGAVGVDQGIEPGEALAGAAGTTDDPVKGGRLVYGIEADTLSPWTPQLSFFAVSGHLVARSIFDMLVMPDVGGEIRPNLLESFSSPDGGTTWELVARPGIVFHDGTPFDGAAIADNIERSRSGLASRFVLTDVVSVEADGMAATITMRRPWNSFPAILTTQIGYMASPAWLAEVDDDPAAALAPVGTGPFIHDSYDPESGTFIAQRNPDYWQPGLPHLDEIEFRVLPGVRDRMDALMSGEVDVTHAVEGDYVRQFRDLGSEIELFESAEFGETAFVLLNQGGVDSPIRDRRLRIALAQAVDWGLLAEVRDAGVFELANGPFPPGTVGHLTDTGYPDHDAEAAAAAIDAIEADRGPVQLSFVLAEDPHNVVTGEMIAGFWEAAGVEVDIEVISQDALAGNVSTGGADAYLFRLHSGIDPDLQSIYWTSENSAEPPAIALNFSRFEDPEIDAALDVIRESSDPEERREAAEAINLRFGQEVYNLWFDWVVWAVAARPGVRDLVSGSVLPDGTPALPTGISFAGSHQTAQIWIDPGVGPMKETP